MQETLLGSKLQVEQKMVVGSQARILYAVAARAHEDCDRHFNECGCFGELSAPMNLGRRHHDVSGQDYLLIETSKHLCMDHKFTG